MPRGPHGKSGGEPAQAWNGLESCGHAASCVAVGSALVRERSGGGRVTQMTTYSPHDDLDLWIARNAPTLLYADGRRVEVGDAVDYGCRWGDEVYWGYVTGVRIGTNEVIVDECLNGPSRAYGPEKLKLLARKDEEETSGAEQAADPERVR